MNKQPVCQQCGSPSLLEVASGHLCSKCAMQRLVVIGEDVSALRQESDAIMIALKRVCNV